MIDVVTILVKNIKLKKKKEICQRLYFPNLSFIERHCLFIETNKDIGKSTGKKCWLVKSNMVFGSRMNKIIIKI